MNMDADILCHYAALSTPNSPKARIDDLVEKNDATAVRGLLEAGFDPNKRNGSGDSPLQVACRFGAEEVVRLLLEHGAGIACVNNAGLSALAIAMEQEAGPAREEVLDLFREHHPELVMEAYCSRQGPGGGR